MATVIERMTPDQIPGLLELIRELASFERLEHEVTVTVESLHESMFGPNAVVTQDVPSHDTVVVEKRRKDRPTVVNV